MSDDWRRLSPRKLVIDPLAVLRSFFFPLVAVVIGVSSSGRPMWTFAVLPAFLLGAVALGVVPWLTTWFRLDEEQFQLRSGLLNKKSSTVRLDRIRSVDLEGQLVHRMLGLRTVRIGTGVDDDRITLDAVTVVEAAELRRVLLARSASGADPRALDDADRGPHPTPPPPPAPEQVLARLDPTWVRFAPFSLARLVVVAGAVGFLTQVLDDFPVLDGDDVRSAWEWVTGFAVLAVVAFLLAIALLGWIALSIVGYLAQWWGLRLSRGAGSLHLVHGLLTTRSVTVEEQRIRGIELEEKVLLRMVRGAELSTLATGVSNGVTAVLPPCPATVARGVGAQVVEDARPLATGLRPHGPAARRRSHVRWQRPTLVLLVVLLALRLDALEPVRDRLDWVPGWLPWAAVPAAALLGALLAEAAYAHLGHALTDRHLVVGSGTSTRRRTVLERDGVIGWVVEQSWFQRRAGLATLVATTAAGQERVTLRDVPHDRAVELAHQVTPAALAPFVRTA
ncbi:PH domain-containing protein [Nocardioides solisilvae]|uniref:PH domain-containing protein n=1 Tax=Nocardioides solisilvae TaxID=1542435 RepID=UPI000D74DCA5|nr:PH domain-containing protein [Nocardioides solisilvae]